MSGANPTTPSPASLSFDTSGPSDRSGSDGETGYRAGLEPCDGGIILTSSAWILARAYCAALYMQEKATRQSRGVSLGTVINAGDEGGRGPVMAADKDKRRLTGSLPHLRVEEPRPVVLPLPPQPTLLPTLC